MRKIETMMIRDNYLEIDYRDKPVLKLTIEFENGYKITYPLSSAKGIRSRALAIVRLFDILEIKRSFELLGKEVRLLRIKNEDGHWKTIAIGHVTKDRFMPLYRGDCTCELETVYEKILSGNTW